MTSSPWRLVWGLGLVSLAADMVYEGARSVYGPALAALGASAAVVGLVTGAGEAAALVLRLAFGPLADRSARYWPLTIAGYALTCVAVPLLALAPRLGAGGLAAAITLILLERTGKAIRSPAKSALLADAAGALGRGRGFGVHKALDQIGAFAGPLLVAAVVGSVGTLWPGFAVLAVPGALALVLLAVLRRAAPDLGTPAAPAPASGWIATATGAGLPRPFFAYAVAASLTTGGLVTFGVLGYHQTTRHLLTTAHVPIAYAVAMAVEAVAALGVGAAYDRVGARVLLLVPPLVAVVPPLALSGRLVLALAGLVVWGVAVGVQDSTIKALVAELVEPARRATAYGVFAGIQGAFAIVGGLGIGWLYERPLTALVVVVAVTQAAALAILAAGVRTRARRS